MYSTLFAVVDYNKINILIDVKHRFTLSAQRMSKERVELTQSTLLGSNK